MRLVVDNWILTTIRHKNEDQQVKANSLTVDQRVEQEQNLFDTSHDLDSSHSSSKSLNQIEVDEDKMQNDADMIKDFESYLYNVLDVSSFGQVEAHLDQLAKMMRHLNDEYHVLKNELDKQFFDDQNQMVKFVQDTLCMKNLLMCQSVSVLERAIATILESVQGQLDHQSCVKVKRMLQQIQRANGSMINTVKTMLKQSISRMQNNVHIWNEFDDVCKQLDTIFSKHTTPFVCSLQYRSISIEINNNINRLKEKLNTLTSVLSEAKYFELKNLIVIYEIKFKRLKESSETDNNGTPEAMVPSSARQTVRLNQKQTESPINCSGKLSNYQIKQKTTVTCDKSTFTVNNESTQTESVVYESVMQSDGKKMLLEAYLRNNGNLASCSTSSKKNKSESGTGLMRESGIGTANDDDSLPLTDAEKHCEDDDKLNISVETYHIDSHKKYVRKKTNKLKSMSTLSSSSTCSSSNSQPNVAYQRKNKKSKQVSSHELNQQISSQSLLRFLLLKLIKFIFIFLLPILFVLLFLAYVLYRNYLNPNCCDMKRNYLLINVT
ncbi:hypothetical protein BpHYR1_000129 [Brachionus plicatilis]|uniref:KASH domain-containing protein n=1 Tax=Brachionus plicatilis TaxID=10195 RepID=A0A3M7SCS1_BRAPC|nr:hypothetical protein BpHYR1_000129 [Brachionus plicatilis]